MRLHQIRKLPQNKGDNQQNEKAAYRMGRNSCKLFSPTFGENVNTDVWVWSVVLVKNKTKI